MQLNRTLFLAVALVLLSAGAASAQSLSPMHNSGTTPSNVKGFRLLIGNPYKVPMTFEIIPMDTAFAIIADHAVVQPSQITIGPGLSRSVMVAFAIGDDVKERTIGVCVQPKDLEGTVLPRVCGTYTGILLVPQGG